MNFDASKFEANLEKRNRASKEAKDLSGFVNTIRYVWNHYPVEEIDFNSFSYRDVLDTIQAMEELPLTQVADSEEVFYVDTSNPFMQYNRIEDTIARLFHHKNKLFYSDDEILFI